MKSDTLLNAKDIAIAVDRLGLQVLERNHSFDSLAIVGIHTGGVFLAERILEFIRQQTDYNIPYGSLDINLYRDDWSLVSQNPVVKTTDISFSVENKDILLVDDVLFTGRTIRAAMEALIDFGRPRSIQLAVLVDRGGREFPIQADYVGLVTTVRADERIQVLFQEQGGTDEVILQNPQ